MISSSASSSRPSGARHDAAYQWCAVAYFGFRLMARWNSRSAPVQSQSCVALTSASDVCASADRSSSMTAVVALDGGLRPDLGRPADAVVSEQPVRVGQAAVRQRVLRVLAERPFEEVERLAAGLPRCADSGDSGPAGTDSARRGWRPADCAPTRRAGIGRVRARASRTTRRATCSCTPNTSSVDPSTDSDQR